MPGKQSPSNILIISPHADDEVVGCGGTIARLTEAGNAVTVLVMACGGIKHRHLQAPATLQERTAELATSCEMLGASCAPILYPDNDMALDTMPHAGLVGRLDSEIDRLKPDIVLLPQPDTNGDHHATHAAAMAALRPGAHRSVCQVLAYETATGFWGGAGNPYWLYVDIAAQLERKLAALSAYRSQLRPAPHPVSAEAVRVRARAAGMECGRDAAERFLLLRALV